MSIKDAYDVVVIGGGPAGMMSAGRAAERGLSVLLVEKNEVLGKKLSISGGGRCNITNAEFDLRSLLPHYKTAEQFLYSPFTQFNSKHTFTFFEEKKLPLIVEDRKRAFPNTEKATDVVRVMDAYIRSAGVEVLLGTSVKGFKMDSGVIAGVITDAGVFTAQSYILASGGRSRPETGSTGEGFLWLEEVGHSIHKSNPNLVPLVVKEKWVERVAGTVCEHARITFKNSSGKVSKLGNVLFTHFGLSGPTVLNSAFEVRKMLETGSVETTIDLFPKEDIGTIRKRFQKLSEAHGNKSLYNALREWFVAGVVDAILIPFSKDIAEQKMHTLTRDVRHAIVDRIKGITLTVTEVKGLDWAVVSDGGVDIKEIDMRTMRSRIHANLFIIGDVLHVSRPTGGYSLQLCWTTGWVAGNNACST